MKIDDIQKALKVLSEREQSQYIVVYSAALVLCGADIEANDVNLQATSQREFTLSFMEREMIPTIRPDRKLPTIFITDEIEAFYSEEANSRLLMMPYGTPELIFRTTNGIQHLSPLGCMRWYQLAIEDYNLPKHHELMKISMDLYFKERESTRKTDILTP